MILIKIEERHGFNGWSEHFTYYKNFKVKDYDTEITETTILEEFFGEDDERVESSKVKSIEELTETELKTLKKFNIVY